MKNEKRVLKNVAQGNLGKTKVIKYVERLGST